MSSGLLDIEEKFINHNEPIRQTMMQITADMMQAMQAGAHFIEGTFQRGRLSRPEKTFMKRKGRPPVWVLGCPRSGTGMLTHMLERLGVFMGHELDILPTGENTREAVFFEEIDGWIMQMGHGHAPAAAAWFGRENFKKLVEDYIRLLMTSPNVLSFLGPKLHKTYRTPFNLDILWGWKSTTLPFTLPLWLEIFPQAKAVHIVRNAAAVARSVKKLHPATEQKLRDFLDKMPDRPRRSKVNFAKDKISFQFLADDFPAQFWLSAWENTVKTAEANLALMPANNRIQVRYEDLLRNSGPELKKLCQFLEIKPAASRLKGIGKTVKPERADAFKQEPEYRQLYESFKNSPQMVKYGYSVL